MPQSFYYLPLTSSSLLPGIIICAIVPSWLIVFLLMVPANRFDFAGGFSGYQLKMMQEVIKLVVFCVFAILILKEPLQFRYLISFAFLLEAVYFMFKK